MVPEAMTVPGAETHRPEKELLASARSGNEDAFRNLTEPYRYQLQVDCYRMLASPFEAEDLVQETFLRA